MTSHGYKQNEIPQELSIGTKIFKTSYYTCLLDFTLSVYPHRAGLKNMPGHGGIRTYDLWNTSPMLCPEFQMQPFKPGNPTFSKFPI